MTECERIIEEGIVPRDFLKEETRCDFFVDLNRKKLWMVELDLLNKLDNICKKHNLRYFLIYGTLLGAIRHHGFIPWDDDIDVIMFREDYEKLVGLSDEFQYPYFFQTPQTDPNYFYSFAKIRNENTTFVSDAFSFQGFHAGVFLDIMVLDNWIPADGKIVYDFVKYLIIENSIYMRKKNPNLSQSDLKRVMQWKGLDPLFVYNMIQKTGQMFRDCETEYCADSTMTIYGYGRSVFKKHFFREATYVQFENLHLPVPADYDSCLKTTYSNYMELPPLDKRGMWHPNYIIDTDLSYKVRLKNL